MLITLFRLLLGHYTTEVPGCYSPEQLATHAGSGLPSTRAACNPWRFQAATYPSSLTATHGGCGLPPTRAACNPWRFRAATHSSSLPPMEIRDCHLPEQVPGC